MKRRTETIPVELADGVIMNVEATVLSGEEDVAFDVLSFENVTTAIERIAAAVIVPLRKVKPHKASVEFGLEVALEAGKLTTLLTQSSTTANLKITLEWSEQLST